LLAYRQDPFPFAGLKCVFWSFVELDSSTLADMSEERAAHDQHIVDHMPRFTKFDHPLSPESFADSTDSATASTSIEEGASEITDTMSKVGLARNNLIFNTWAELQILQFFLCSFSKVVAGYWQFFAVENLDFVKVATDLENYLDNNFSSMCQHLNIKIPAIVLEEVGSGSVDEGDRASASQGPATMSQKASINGDSNKNNANFSTTDTDPQQEHGEAETSRGSQGGEGQKSKTADESKQSNPQVKASIEEQCYLFHRFEELMKFFFQLNPDFVVFLNQLMSAWSPEFEESVTVAKQPDPSKPLLSSIPKYLGDNLYLADALSRNNDQMFRNIEFLLQSYGTGNEEFWVIRTRNFKLVQVFGTQFFTRCVGEEFGCVIADSFIVFRPRQFPRVRLMFEIASIFLQDESSDSRTNTANNRVPRMGFCTNMTLIEAFKPNVSILFGGADRVDRKCAQLGDCWSWNTAVEEKYPY
jgi:hypothetical protein